MFENENGNVIARRDFSEGEGVVVADMVWDTSKPKRVQDYPERYWIPDLPDSYINAWETKNPQAQKYYGTIAMKYYMGNRF